MKVAILGANGFVGFRLFEAWTRSGRHAPRAVVRGPASLARIARFAAPDWRLADAGDEAALAAAFAGCDAVVHSIAGDPHTIMGTIEPAWRAAQAAGVRHFVFLSSASVHGQNPAPGTDEESPLHTRHALAYNNAKVRAERRLERLAAGGAMAAVALRPGIVWGPRARWADETLAALRAGQAAWVGGGRGICNLCHVDNLIQAIECALAAGRPGFRAYLVGDAETKTWRDFQGALAALGGWDAGAFAEATPTAPQPRTWRDRLGALKATAAAQAVLGWIPWRAKEGMKGALARGLAAPAGNPFALPKPPAVPPATLEMSLLYACTAKLPHARAARELGYAPPVSFEEGLRRTAAWLAASGELDAGPPASAR